ncbi:hypothetical protein CTheo_3414 [Ceratobasidium theobromae]|uniref:Ribosomal RNA methyltransferase FtsJ domain-containing protein n=1 Tax=Ceratobasidium theobromae TaxID=1582974 RepID=A0A5N5QMU6_9AGAM|nr:hypothetical protein CTheo_3414 [Ceratobasidium theobromae]
MTDITSLDLAPSLTSPASPLTVNSKSTLVSPIPFDLNSFDFVICDAHHLHDQQLQIEPHLRDPTRLLISQVLLALRAVYNGGKILLRLSCVEKPLTAQILLAFWRISGHTETIKSLTLNKRLETFYLLAQGIRINTSEYRKLVDALEKLWYWMTFGGEGGVGRNITWEEQEMITSWEEVMSEGGINQIVRLGIKVWEIQCCALYGFLKSEGILQSKGIEIDIF